MSSETMSASSYIKIIKGTICIGILALNDFSTGIKAASNSEVELGIMQF